MLAALIAMYVIASLFAGLITVHGMEVAFGFVDEFPPRQRAAIFAAGALLWPLGLAYVLLGAPIAVGAWLYDRLTRSE